jgi:hypothetical protein
VQGNLKLDGINGIASSARCRQTLFARDLPRDGELLAPLAPPLMRAIR